ncbi:MAG: DciA family protein [Burkholderiales bacterium]
MPARKIGNLLTASGELKALYRHAQRLLELQQVFSDSAPAALARASRVKSCRGGTLHILADNAAVAAKLRQLTPRLLLLVQKREPQITGIQVAVQVAKAAATTRKTPANPALSLDSIEKFRLLSEQTPDSPLKSALTNLVRRHSRPR